VLLFLHFMGANDPNSNSLGYFFIIFGCVMGVGAVFAWGWIPEVQKGRGEGGGLGLVSKTPEELGEGVRGEGNGV
jgi:hypothetical protein